MTDLQKLQQELEAMKAEFEATKAAHTVGCNAPELKRSYAYRVSPAIKAEDLAL